MFVLLCLPAVLLITFGVWQGRNQVLNQYQQQAIAIAEQIALQQHADMNHMRSLLKQVGQQAALFDFEQGCQPLLQTTLALNPQLANIGIVAPNGEVMCNVSEPERGINIADRPYFQTALSGQSFVIGQFQHDRSVHTKTLNFATPLYQAGKVAYVLVAVKSLNHWSHQLAKTKLPFGSKVWVTDRDQHILAHYPFVAASLGQYIDPQWQQQQDAPFTLRNVNNKRYLLTSKALAIANQHESLTLTVAVPFDNAYSTVERHFLWLAALLLGIFLGLAGWARYQLHALLLKPLEQLLYNIDSLGKGTLAIQHDTPHSPELKQVHDTFLAMANTRLAAEMALTAKHDELVALLSALPDSYLRIDADNHVCMQFGHFFPTLDDTQPLQLETLLPHSVVTRLAQPLQRCIHDGQESVIECQLEVATEPHASPRIYEFRLQPLSSQRQAIVVIRDISRRKQSEEAMRLAALVYENSSEGMAVTDANGYILDVNPAFTQVTGFSRQEVLGQNTAMLSSGKHDAAFYQAMWQKLNDSGKWQGEIINRKKDGELFTEWLTINTIYNDRGEPYRRVANFTDITEKKRQDEVIWRQAHFDLLTDLANRTELKKQLRQQLSKLNDQATLAVLLLDLDHFKDINDTLGHFHGDQVLKSVSALLKARCSDGMLLSRIGGDEFVVVFSAQSKLDAMQFAEHLQRVFQTPLLIDNEYHHLSASIGIAFAPEDGKNSEQLLKAADQAMYQAKQQGRNTIAVFSHSMREQAMLRMRLLRQLRSALPNQEFNLLYQPIINLSSRQFVKAECLIRWQHPRSGMISPAEFIPLAEETRLILPLSDWIFATALESLTELKRVNSEFQLSINVSPVQLSNAHSRIGEWQRNLIKTGLTPKDIVLEITEGVMMSDSALTKQRLQDLRSADLQLALDDFGTGYSSLAYLQKLQCDFIKIDKRFVDNLATEREAQVLCEAIIAMAHQLGLKVIAEGIESAQQDALLSAMGCDYGQGYYYAKPMPLSQLLNTLS
ncbi:EAL domain-containing protein [Pseudoalteromonas fenneropenaei]|uniref:EAL domain-containing protein n=1 Tax=Pseudoalteromonas fenneropenaei TaxID=1737459 RepID=A0ABV7CKK3_9GAMM